jgi:hypothetical protein
MCASQEHFCSIIQFSDTNLIENSILNIELSFEVDPQLSNKKVPTMPYEFFQQNIFQFYGGMFSRIQTQKIQSGLGFEEIRVSL